MTTPSRQAAVWRSGQRLHFISTRSLVHPFAAVRHFPSRGNKRWSRWTLRPLEGETRRYGWQGLWALMKRRAERSPATLGLATFRSEISPLRFAAVEMTVAVSSRAEGHIGMGGKNLNPFEPYEPGPRSGPSSRPLPSRCARHPPPGRGWASNMEENVALKTCRLWVERDREAAEGGLIKLAAKPPPSPSEPFEPSEPGPQSGPIAPPPHSEPFEPEPQRALL